MKEETKQNLKRSSTWLRFIFMILFIIFFNVAEYLLMLIVAFQFVFTLITASPNEKVAPFSRQLTQYIRDVLMYLSYNREERPFPFGDWPADPGKDATAVVKKS